MNPEFKMATPKILFTENEVKAKPEKTLVFFVYVYIAVINSVEFYKYQKYIIFISAFIGFIQIMCKFIIKRNEFLQKPCLVSVINNSESVFKNRGNIR